MVDHGVENQTDQLRILIEDLLRQGERCALAGLLPQARELMVQAWSIAEGVDQQLANSAAWESGWLHVRTGAYHEAAEWFSRISSLGDTRPQLWPASQQALIDLCGLGAGQERTISEPVLETSGLPVLRVKNLGQFKIIRDGKTLPTLGSRKAMAIFRYLLTRRTHAASKEELMELLWPEASPHAASHSLHTAVSTLRNHIDPAHGSYIVFESGRYLINPGASVFDDSTLFQRCVDEAEKQALRGNTAQSQQEFIQALDHYAGDYHVEDADQLWAVAERERLIARYLTVLDHLGHIFMDQGAFEDAISCYKRLLDRDSYREDAHTRVIDCYLMLGRRNEALRQYNDCVEILERDLGIEPDQAIQQRYRSIIEALPSRLS